MRIQRYANISPRACMKSEILHSVPWRGLHGEEGKSRTSGADVRTGAEAGAKLTAASALTKSGAAEYHESAESRSFLFLTERVRICELAE